MKTAIHGATVSEDIQTGGSRTGVNSIILRRWDYGTPYPSEKLNAELTLQQLYWVTDGRGRQA
jgi:hypothetical protein